jgi:acyl homoserine lactone synthase
MIKLIQANQAHRHSELIDQMFCLRARAFRDRLSWDVNVVDGRERDRFDDCDPLYVLSLNDAGRVIGSARLLQTTGPNMLADVFPQLLPIGSSVRSPLVWESTRFCVDTDLSQTTGSTGLNAAAGEIMACEIEIGLAAGLSHIVTVVDVRMERVLRRSGCGFERLAPPVRIGIALSVAGLIAVNPSVHANIRAAHSVEKQATTVGSRPQTQAA